MPPGGLPGVAAGSLLKIVRAVYGLVNSPRLWWRALKERLLELGAKQSKWDPALFMFYETIDIVRHLVLVLGVHVDDLICACMPVFGERIWSKITSVFEFGSPIINNLFIVESMLCKSLMALWLLLRKILPPQ